jgi:hypothetical protein
MSEQQICHKCIGDEIVKLEISNSEVVSKCSFCGTIGNVVKLDGIIDRIGAIIADNFNSDYEIRPQGGYLLTSVVKLIAKTPHKATTAIVDILTNEVKIMRGALGIELLFDREVRYNETKASNVSYFKVWPEFKASVKHLIRFFNTKAKQVLDDIFMPTEIARVSKGSRPIITIKANDSTYFYRGRIASDGDQIKAYLQKPRQELGPIPPMLATPGRMNPQGISMFYLSFNKRTCVTELRPPIGSSVVIAGFKLKKDIKVLDISLLAKGIRPNSYFDPNLSAVKEKITFLSSIEAEMTRPIFPGNELLDYLPTQVIAEYLSTQFHAKLDGIVLRSAQSAGKTGKNLILFPQIAHDYIRFTSMIGASKGGTIDPAIELDENTLSVEYITGVAYKTRTRNIRRKR